ncbi:MAG: hypothetical protein ACFFCT_04540 [Candidatus Odinarchaeota archaeon]
MDILTEVIELILILGIGSLLRYIPHLRYKYPSTPDAYFFMNKFKNPDYESEQVDYPKLLYQLFGFFLQNKQEIPDRTINKITPLFDLTTAVLLYVFLKPTFNVELALVTTLLFLVTPFTVKHGVSLSGRPFGLLLFTASLLCLTLPVPFNWIAVFPMAFVMLSHRLSTQTLFGFCLVFTLFDWQVGLILLTAFTIALLLSKGEYMRILRNHIAAVRKYIKKGHYPNQRLMGLLLTPTIAGFVVYTVILLLQNLVEFPIEIGSFMVYQVTVIEPYTELLFIVWSVVCIFLLLFWIAGESFRHLYLAAVPFAFFSVRILQNGAIFFFLIIFLILGSFGLSLYFSLRYEHLDTEFVSMLQYLKEIPEPVRFIVPYRLLRAAEYFSDKKGVALYFPELSDEALSKRLADEGSTHAIINTQNRERFKSWKELDHEGNWFLLERG